MTVHVRGPRDPRVAGAVNCCSNAATAWMTGLSPFVLGPCPLYGGHISRTMENGWQYAKLYAAHADAAGEPTAAHRRWAEAGWANPRAVRYPMGKGAVPLCSLWQGERLDYIAARRRIYLPLYAEAVHATEAFARLRRQYEADGTIVLWDFDGYDHHALGRSLDDVLAQSDRKMGHAFVLAMLLERHPLVAAWL